MLDRFKNLFRASKAPTGTVARAAAESRHEPAPGSREEPRSYTVPPTPPTPPDGDTTIVDENAPTSSGPIELPPHSDDDASSGPMPKDAPPKLVDVPDSPLRPRVIDAIKTVYDPEIPVDVYELGLIYGIHIDAAGNVQVDMTLTSPSCPSAEQLPGDVEKRARAVEGVNDVRVEVVWDPPWDKDKMSEAARLELGID